MTAERTSRRGRSAGVRGVGGRTEAERPPVGPDVDAAMGQPFAIAAVRARRLVVGRPRVRIALVPGDRPLVEAGARVARGEQLADRVRDAHLVETVAASGRADLGPGSWLSAEHARPGRRESAPAGEVLYEDAGRRLLASGPHLDTLEAPAPATVEVVEAGAAIVLELDGVGISGQALLGDVVHGPLAVLPPDADPRLALDVGLAGAIVVLPGRADAEALTRARAMGIAGVVVGSLAERDRRDIAASEARQRSGLHRLAPFGVLVLDGYLRRPIATPVRALFDALAGSVVGLAGDPPMLVADPPLGGFSVPPPDWVRVIGGTEAGREGRWLGPAGPRHLRAGIVAETAFVSLDDGPPMPIAVGDLERFC